MTAAVEPAARRGLGDRWWRLWAATAVSNVGDGMEVVALPLLAASLTDDPRLVAGVATAATLPWLVFTLVSGAVVDLSDRRRLMVGVNLARFALVGLLAALVATEQVTLPVLYAVVFLMGIGQNLFDSASQAIVPDLVRTDQLESANGYRQTAEMVGQSFAGPPAGALLFAAVAFAPFAVDAATFLVAAALVRSIRGEYRPPRAAAARRSIRSDIAEGLRWLASHPLLRPLAGVLAVANLAVYMTEAILVLFATRELGLSERAFGLLVAGMAAGGVLGGLFGARMARALGTARSVAATVAVIGAANLVVAFLDHAVAVGAVLALTGLATSVWNIVTISLRQAVIPRYLLGRVNSAYRTVGMGAMPVGAVVGGLVANAAGLRAPFLLAAGLCLAALALAVTRITDGAIAAARAANAAPAP